MRFLRALLGLRSTRPPPPNWSIVRAINEDRQEAAVIRIRTDKPSDFAKLGTAIEISWRYESDTPFPKTRDNEQMLEFERALDELAGENGYSELAQVSTGNGMKEWLFYSSNQHRFIDRMNSLLKSHPVYPIEIRFYEDSGWQIWSETATALESRGDG